MNLELSPAEMQCHAAVLALLKHKLPADISEKVPGFRRFTLINATFGDVDHHVGVISDKIRAERA